jgi:glutamine synthetase
MLGSNLSISGPNIVLNTIVAEILCQFADELEASKDFTAALDALIKKTIRAHKRIIFNRDGYSKKWQREAEKRGLLNLKTAVEALPYLVSKKSIGLFAKHRVFTESKVRSRCDIMLETYAKTINIEALPMIEIVKKDILPSRVKVYAYACKHNPCKENLK